MRQYTLNEDRVCDLITWTNAAIDDLRAAAGPQAMDERWNRGECIGEMIRNVFGIITEDEE